MVKVFTLTVQTYFVVRILLPAVSPSSRARKTPLHSESKQSKSFVSYVHMYARDYFFLNLCETVPGNIPRDVSWGTKFNPTTANQNHCTISPPHHIDVCKFWVPLGTLLTNVEGTLLVPFCLLCNYRSYFCSLL